MQLDWTRDEDQHIATGKQAEYRIYEPAPTWLLMVAQFSTGKTTVGGFYPSLQRAKEAAYSLDIR